MSQPTTQDLADDFVASVDGSIEQTTPLLAKAFTRVVAKVHAGANVLIYKYASWSLLQMFATHASFRETTILGRVVRPLVEIGRRNGTGDPHAAERAQLAVTVTVLVQSGNLAANLQLVHAPTGVVYVVASSVALNAPTVTAVVRAVSDQNGGDGAGSVGNLLPGAVLQFANPPANFSRNAVVQSQVVTGADAESEDDYRARVIRRGQQRPQGGSYADYQAWGEEAAGIVHVYPYTADPGVVRVFVEATPESSGSADGIPTVGQRNAVLALIEQTKAGLASRRPVNAWVDVQPIARTAFDVQVTGLIVDDLTAAEDAIEAALIEYLFAREPFIVGLSQLPRTDRITKAALSGIVDDVASSLGGTVATLRFGTGSGDVNAYTLSKGEKAKLGNLTFI